MVSECAAGPGKCRFVHSRCRPDSAPTCRFCCVHLPLPIVSSPSVRWLVAADCGAWAAAAEFACKRLLGRCQGQMWGATSAAPCGSAHRSALSLSLSSLPQPVQPALVLGVHVLSVIAALGLVQLPFVRRGVVPTADLHTHTHLSGHNALLVVTSTSSAAYPGCDKVGHVLKQLPLPCWVVVHVHLVHGVGPSCGCVYLRGAGTRGENWVSSCFPSTSSQH